MLRLVKKLNEQLHITNSVMCKTRNHSNSLIFHKISSWFSTQNLLYPALFLLLHNPQWPTQCCQYRFPSNNVFSSAESSKPHGQGINPRLKFVELLKAIQINCINKRTYFLLFLQQCHICLHRICFLQKWNHVILSPLDHVFDFSFTES